MKNTLTIGVFLVQPFALYLQVRDIVENKGYQLFFYFLGAAFLGVGIYLFIQERKKQKEKTAPEKGEDSFNWKEPVISIIEGFILVLAPIVAKDYVRRIDWWAEYAENKVEKEQYTDLQPREQYQQAIMLLAPDRMEAAEAFELAESAAKKNCPAAFDLLGQMYAEGIGCPVDYELSAFNFAQATMWGAVSLPERLKKYPELINTNNSKVRDIIEECEKNTAIIDSLNGALIRKRGSEMEGAALIEVNREILETLSKKGYLLATVILYQRANIKKDTLATNAMAQRMMDAGFVPDSPVERYFFYRQLNPGIPGPEDAFGLEELNRRIDSEDFYLTLSEKSGEQVDLMDDSIAPDDLYRYTRAQLRRSLYLKQNGSRLQNVTELQEDMDAYYQKAKRWHESAINIVEEQIVLQKLQNVDGLN